MNTKLSKLFGVLMISGFTAGHGFAQETTPPMEDRTPAEGGCATLNEMDAEQAEHFLNGFSQGYAAATAGVGGEEAEVVDGVPNVTEGGETRLGIDAMVDTEALLQACRDAPELTLVDALHQTQQQ